MRKNKKKCKKSELNVMNRRTIFGHDVICMNMNDFEMYIPTPENKDNIIDVILKIMEDEGPVPMRHLKPAQKIRNGAEQFDKEHQEQYEARGRQPDKVSRVSQHNNACPKMYDELNKRKSITRTIAIDSKPTPQKRAYDSKRRVGVKKKTLKVIKKSKLRSKYRRSSTRTMRRDSRAQETKSKSRNRQNSLYSPYITYQLSRIAANKSCQSQYAKYMRNVTTSDVSFNLISKSSKAMAGALRKQFDNEPYSERNANYPVPAEKRCSSSKEFNKQESETKNNTECRNPDVSQPSVSSYNSFLSMDHEPMVTT